MIENFTSVIEATAGLTQSALNLFLQSTALIVVGLLIGRALRRHGSAVQSAIYRATLVTILVCPLAAILLNSFGIQGWSIQVPSTHHSITLEVAGTFTDLAPPIVAPPLDFGSDAVSHSVNGDPDINLPMEGDENFTTPEFSSLPLASFQPVRSAEIRDPAPDTELETRSVGSPATIVVYCLFSSIWVLGAAYLLVRLAIAYRKLGRLRYESSFASESDRQVCAVIARRMNVCLPEIRRNSLLSSPCLTGIAAPTILLPSEINDSRLLEKAFAHELGHLRRRDTLWNLIQRVALAFVFFQPLLWRLVYRLETTAEEVCDDHVVRHCQDRTGYAQQLIELAESNLLAPNMAGLGMFKTNRSMLGQRVIRILDSTRTLTTHISGPIVVTITSLAIVCATFGGFIGNGNSSLTLFDSADSATLSSDDLGEETLIKVSGRVLDPDGSPVGNASVSVFPSAFSSTELGNPPAYVTTHSDGDGAFELSFPKSSLINSRTGFARERNYCVVATAPGFGINWIDADELKELAVNSSEIANLEFKPADIHLSRDTTKINLRLIDPEGNPISNATARVTGITRFQNEDIGPFYQLHAQGEVYTKQSISDDLLIHGLSAYKTTENGELLIAGLGDNRIAKLDITGPEIAIQSVRAATRNTETVSVTYGGMNALRLTTHGSASTITCEPTQPIVGRVFDRESKQPLAGIKIMSSKFAGTNLAGINSLQTESDGEGRFRLVGMPKGPGNDIIAVPGDRQPYFMMRFEVSSAPGLEPTEMELPLQRGTFIRGKATNLKTGSPIAGATLHYLPYLSNDQAAASPVYEDRQFMEIQNRYVTGLDGSFQLVGLPGRGVVGINVYDGFFPSGMGWETLDEQEKSNDAYGHVKTFRRPVTPSRLWPTAMLQVDVDADQTEKIVEFKLDPGLSIPVKITDPDGRPLIGVNTARLRSRNDRYTTTTSTPTATAFAKHETRLVKLEHPAKALSRIVELNAVILDSKGELADPVQIKLMPNAAVTGRLVDGNGDAIVRGEIRFDVGGGRNFGMMLSRVMTDENGQFSMDDVPSGTYYSISVSTATGFFSVNKRLEVAAGERIDLGTIDVTDKDNRPEPKRSGREADGDARPKPANGSPNDTTFSGTVVDSNGTPIAGAKVYRKTHDTISGVDGSFALKISNSEIQEFKGPPVLFAIKSGYGRAFCALKAIRTANSMELKDATQLELVLPTDDHPIAGRLVDPEGHPITGATIEIDYISEPGSIDAYLEAAARDQATLRDLPQGSAFVDEQIPVFESDAEGKFLIYGIGNGRAVRLKIKGKAIAVTKPIVVTAKTPPLAVYRESGMFGNQFGKVEIHGHQPTIVCEPTQVIAGVVVDRETGKPLAGVDVYSDRFSDVPISGIRDLKSTTDKNGRFELSGMPIGPDNEISAFPPTDGDSAMPYLARDLSIPAADGLQPVNVRIELQRGEWVRGKVIDLKTGQPVAAARITYKPYNDNPLAAELYSKSRIPDPIGFLETEADGLFQFVALPGKSLLDVWVVRQPYYPPGQGWSKIPADRIDQQGNVRSQGYPSNRQHPTAMQEINVIAGQPVDDLLFELDPGTSVLVKLQDPAGEPLPGVKIENASSNVSQDYYTKDQSEFEATGFLNGQRRTLTFYHKDRNLGWIQTIGDGDKSPVIVTLQPNAAITGKLVDNNGDPLPRANLRFDLTENRNFFLKHAPFKYITDENGVFSQVAIPGQYKVQVETLNDFFVLDLSLEVSAGDQIDMGTLDVAAIHKRIMDGLNGRTNQTPSQTDSTSIAGTVVDENNRPISEADVSLRLRYRPNLMKTPIATTTTDRSGNFKIQYETNSVSQYPKLQRDDFNTTIEITKNGFARGWVNVCQIANLKSTVKLSPNVVDVELSLIDLEGNPIPGTAAAEIYSIRQFNQPLSRIVSDSNDVEKQLSKFMTNNGRFFVDDRLKAEATDQGRIRFTNLGDNRLYWGRIEGSKIANRYFQFATGIKSDKKYGIPGDVEMEDEQQILFANGSQIVCEPGQTAKGTVRDGKTGKPISGVQLTGFSSPALPYSVLGVFDGRSGEQGRFHVDGLGVGGSNTFFAVKHSDPPYVSRFIQVPTTGPERPPEFEFKMFRGGRIKVQVIDSATSEPIPAARVFFAPLHANPANDKYPEHKTGGVFNLCPGETPLTDIDGKCELTGMPGRGIIGVRIFESKIRQGQGGEAITRVLGDKVFPPIGDGNRFVTTRHHVGSSVTAVKLIEVKNVDAITDVRLEIDTTPVK